MRGRQRVRALAWLIASFVMVWSPLASAAISSSSSYQVGEVIFGAGGALSNCSSGSTGYCAKMTAGEIAAGNAAGTAFQAQAGFNTDRSPYIAFSVAGGSTDLGTLSTIATATLNATFSVKTYLASGYVVQLASDPPTNNSPTPHQITPLSSPTASSIGAEQFGLNVVQNLTSCTNPAPVNFGADPVQVPSNVFSFGTVNSGYNTCGLFKYNKGDIIVSSNKSSGETDYTLSFIYNISPTTPDGLYTFNGSLVATSTY